MTDEALAQREKALAEATEKIAELNAPINLQSPPRGRPTEEASSATNPAAAEGAAPEESPASGTAIRDGDGVTMEVFLARIKARAEARAVEHARLGKETLVDPATKRREANVTFGNGIDNTRDVDGRKLTGRRVRRVIDGKVTWPLQSPQGPQSPELLKEVKSRASLTKSPANSPASHSPRALADSNDATRDDPSPSQLTIAERRAMFAGAAK